jgi:hypothetical protein
MLFNGVKKQKVNIGIILFLFSISSMAEDFGIAMPDQLSDKEYEVKLKSTSEEVDSSIDSYVMGDSEPSDLKAEGEPSFSVPGEGNLSEIEEPNEKEKLLSTGYKPPHSLDDKENLVTFKNREIYDNFYDKGTSSFSFSYVRDDYSVKDGRGVFQRSFVDADEARRGGYLHLVFDNYINRAFFSTFYGFGAGVGFSEGEGIFSSSSTTKSNVSFQLFTIPLDLRLGMSIGYGKYIRLSAAGGPSAMIISQSRSDKDRGEDEKHRRQYSFGYFGHAKVQFSVAAIFEKIAYEGFGQYDMTNMYLNLEARYQSYESFKDDLSITGTSVGLGFTFEYL